jgi:hypothetical protein
MRGYYAYQNRYAETHVMLQDDAPKSSATDSSSGDGTSSQATSTDSPQV